MKKEAMFSVSCSRPGAETERRAFYDLSGEKNYFVYMAEAGRKAAAPTEGISSGIFDFSGMLPSMTLEAMRRNASEEPKIIWFGFFSLCPQYASALETAGRAQAMSARILPELYSELGLERERMTAAAALHHNRPSHYHVHFTFWEREPGPDGYARSGRTGTGVSMKMRSRLIDAAKEACGADFSFDRSGTVGFLRDLRADARPDFTGPLARELAVAAECIPQGYEKSYGEIDSPHLKARLDRITGMLLASDRKAAGIYDVFVSALHSDREECSRFTGNAAAESRLRRNARAGEFFENAIRNRVLDGVKSVREFIPDSSETGRASVNDPVRKRFARNLENRVACVTRDLKETFGSDCFNAAKFAGQYLVPTAANVASMRKIDEKNAERPRGREK